MQRSILLLSFIVLLSGQSFAMGNKPYQKAKADNDMECTERQSPERDMSATDSECDTASARPVITAKTEREITYEAESFIAPLDWEADGFVTGEKDKKLLISAGDTVYVNIGKDRVKQGTPCMVYRVEEKVKDRETGDVIGYEMRRVARLIVTSGVGEKASTAKVTVSYEPIEVGDVVTVMQKDSR